MPAATKEKNSKNEAIDTKKFDTEKIEKIYTYIFFGKINSQCFMLSYEAMTSLWPLSVL